MPVITRQLIMANSHFPGFGIAQDLAILAVEKFTAVRPAHVGIGDGSCCAAVAVVPGGAYHAVGPPYTPVFGNSQMARGGLVPEDVGGHAERAALTAAGNSHLALYLIPGSANAVLFVELSPCGGCAPWLAGGGGGMANPYSAAIAGGTTLNVWYRWVYNAAGVAAMNASHASSTVQQTADILALG